MRGQRHAAAALYPRERLGAHSKSSGPSETEQHWIDTSFHIPLRGLTQVYGHAVSIGHVCLVSLNHMLDFTLTIC